ncbi:MAG TPA: polysaccharide deacetylase family protein [Acidobacteriaceae bacterium]|nr:polysaccharide deacetylase family protein [Acidobacteriaceae bacterium]
MRWRVYLSGFDLIVILCICGLVARAQKGIPILTYHRFDSKTPASSTVTTAAFLSQLDTLETNGYTVVPLETVTDILLGSAQAPVDPIAAITVDDGHSSVYTVLFPIIKQRRIPITLFIYPSAISNASYALTWDQIREMLASGLVDVQSHTYWHPDFRKEKVRRSTGDYAAFVDTQLSR